MSTHRPGLGLVPLFQFLSDLVEPLSDLFILVTAFRATISQGKKLVSKEFKVAPNLNTFSKILSTSSNPWKDPKFLDDKFRYFSLWQGPKGSIILGDSSDIKDGEGVICKGHQIDYDTTAKGLITLGSPHKNPTKDFAHDGACYYRPGFPIVRKLEIQTDFPAVKAKKLHFDHPTHKAFQIKLGTVPKLELPAKYKIDSLPAAYGPNSDQGAGSFTAPGKYKEMTITPNAIGRVSNPVYNDNGLGKFGASRVLKKDIYPDSGDLPGAWLAQKGEDEWIQIRFDTLKNAASLTVYETFNPGGITKIILSKEGTSDKTVVFQKGQTNFVRHQAKSGAARFHAVFPKVSFDVNLMEIHVDASKEWRGIDAVTLTGQHKNAFKFPGEMDGNVINYTPRASKKWGCDKLRYSASSGGSAGFSSPNDIEICYGCPLNAKTGRVCSGVGRCTDAKCICPKAYDGESCQNLLCPLSSTGKICNHRGRCNTKTVTCECIRGWHGKACTLPMDQYHAHNHYYYIRTWDGTNLHWHYAVRHGDAWGFVDSDPKGMIVKLATRHVHYHWFYNSYGFTIRFQGHNWSSWSHATYINSHIVTGHWHYRWIHRHWDWTNNCRGDWTNNCKVSHHGTSGPVRLHTMKYQSHHWWTWYTYAWIYFRQYTMHLCQYWWGYYHVYYYAPVREVDSNTVTGYFGNMDRNRYNEANDVSYNSCYPNYPGRGQWGQNWHNYWHKNRYYWNFMLAGCNIWSHYNYCNNGHFNNFKARFPIKYRGQTFLQWVRNGMRMSIASDSITPKITKDKVKSMTFVADNEKASSNLTSEAAKLKAEMIAQSAREEKEMLKSMPDHALDKRDKAFLNEQTVESAPIDENKLAADLISLGNKNANIKITDHIEGNPELKEHSVPEDPENPSSFKPGGVHHGMSRKDVSDHYHMLAFVASRVSATAKVQAHVAAMADDDGAEIPDAVKQCSQSILEKCMDKDTCLKFLGSKNRFSECVTTACKASVEGGESSSSAVDDAQKETANEAEDEAEDEAADEEMDAEEEKKEKKDQGAAEKDNWMDNNKKKKA
eukprot:TRINITY_DN3498_c0_g1_i1.p1 TRINITY_DN3498_c0_g1~~TRINITY_DN3498_c0_g1_i1.p1  ORF type:complete len:1056 (-),score=309.19 TRINITY_DN3498_c0_g1_i1:156-3323(-)